MSKLDQMSPTRVNLILFALSIATFLFMYLLNIMLANKLPPELYGDFSVALKFLGILANLALLGTGSSAKRFLAKYLKNDRKRDVFGFLHWNTRHVLGAYLFCVFVGVVSSMVMFYLHIVGITHIESYHLAVYMLWVAPLSATALLFSSYMLCSEHSIISYTLPNAFMYLFLATLFYITFQLFGEEPSNRLITGVLGFSWAVVVLIEGVFIYLKAPVLLQCLRPFSSVRKIDKEEKWRRVSMRLSATQIVYFIVAALDLMILEVVGKSDVEVGYYSAILAIVSIIWILPNGTLQPIAPRVSTLIETASGRVELQRMLGRAVVINVVSGTLALLVIVVFASTFLSHFGPAYVQARPALIVSGCAALVGMIFSPSRIILGYSGQELELLKINLIELSLLLVLGSLFTYFYGIMGIAVATFVSIAVKSFMATVQVRRTFAIRPLGVL